MVVDSSALVAILLGEPEGDALALALAGAEMPVICAPNWLEAASIIVPAAPATPPPASDRAAWVVEVVGATDVIVVYGGERRELAVAQAMSAMVMQGQLAVAAFHPPPELLRWKRSAHSPATCSRRAISVDGKA